MFSNERCIRLPALSAATDVSIGKQWEKVGQLWTCTTGYPCLEVQYIPVEEGRDKKAKFDSKSKRQGRWRLYRSRQPEIRCGKPARQPPTMWNNLQPTAPTTRKNTSQTKTKRTTTHNNVLVTYDVFQVLETPLARGLSLKAPWRKKPWSCRK